MLFVDADHQLQATPRAGKKKTPFSSDVTGHLSGELVTVDQQDGSCVPPRPPNDPFNHTPRDITQDWRAAGSPSSGPDVARDHDGVLTARTEGLTYQLLCGVVTASPPRTRGLLASVCRFVSVDRSLYRLINQLVVYSNKHNELCTCVRYALHC